MSHDESGDATILAVDDLPENLLALRAIFDGQPYRILTASSGAEALSLALREEIDVILLDVMMPGMDGFEVALHLKKLERTRTIPVVFLTAFETEAQRVYQAYAVGAVDYIVKPLDPEMVRRKVAVFVELVAQRRQIERQARQLREAERREFELRLAEMRMASDNRYRKLIEGIDHAIGWTAAPELGDLSFVSRQARGILGYSLDELTRPGFFLDQVHPDDRQRVVETCRRAIDESADQMCDHRIVAADGRVLWFHTGISVDEALDGEPELHGISVDITALKEAVAIAERATRDREDLLAVVSHDLRNPLQLIVAAATVLREDISPDDRARNIDLILRAAHSMDVLIADLLEFAHLEAGGVAVDRQPTEVGALVAESLELLTPLAAQKAIRLEVQDDRAHRESVHCDRRRAARILSNLIGNAIKFTPSGGGIVLATRAGDGEVCFTVSDTGPGIPPEDLPRVFDRHWQGRNKERSGFGLGLAIARRLVEVHGGRIWVESGSASGAIFSFTLPRAA